MHHPAERVNPLTESCHLLSEIGMLLQEGSASTSVNQGMAAEIAWETVSEITDVLGSLVKPVWITVKATLSITNTQSFCYVAWPSVLNGSQCCRVTSNGSLGGGTATDAT